MSAVIAAMLDALASTRAVVAADRLCKACVELLGVEVATMSLLLDSRTVVTLGASGAAGRVVEEVQFAIGEGPTFEAVRRRAPVQVVDIADPAETRWPVYNSVILSHRIRGVYAVPVMMAGHPVGAVTVFQSAPTPLTPTQLAGVHAAADVALLPALDAFVGTRNRAGIQDGVDELLTTLTRAAVNQAVGMVMAGLKIDATAALLRIKAHAYLVDRSTTDVAADILDRRLTLEPH